MALATSILWGACYASTEMTVKYVDIKSYLTISSIVSCIGFLLWGYLDGSIHKDLTGGKLSVALPWILISSIAAFVGSYCSVAAVKYGGASLASIIEISYPVWVIAFTSLICWRNNFSSSLILGGLLIFLGTVVVVRGNSG